MPQTNGTQSKHEMYTSTGSRNVGHKRPVNLMECFIDLLNKIYFCYCYSEFISHSRHRLNSDPLNIQLWIWSGRVEWLNLNRPNFRYRNSFHSDVVFFGSSLYPQFRFHANEFLLAFTIICALINKLFISFTLIPFFHSERKKETGRPNALFIVASGLTTHILYAQCSSFFLLLIPPW